MRAQEEVDEDDEQQLIFVSSERVPPLVQDVFEAKGYSSLSDEEVGGIWHVHWKAGRFKPSEYAAANRGQRVNHFPKTTGITKKDTLLRNLRRMRAIHGSIFSFFPESYILPTEYQTLVRMYGNAAEKPVWILKPTDCSQGRKIFLIRDLSEISCAALCPRAPPPPPGGTIARLTPGALSHLQA
jgi:tubulin polyglutamylase TTLL2